MVSSLTHSLTCFLSLSLSLCNTGYNSTYDRRTHPGQYHVGDWIMVRFPQDESGKNRKLSRPWHGPYWILMCNSPDIVACKVYFPEDGQLQVHQDAYHPMPPRIP